jgi:hypothetical protein
MLDIQCCHIHTKSCQIDITATTEGRLFYYQFLKEPTVHVQSQACVFANSIHAGPKNVPTLVVKLTTFNFTPELKKGGLLKCKVR